jgi:hypothetical protein
MTESCPRRWFLQCQGINVTPSNDIAVNRQQQPWGVHCASEQPTSETLSKLDALMKGIDHATAGVNRICSRK